MRNHQCSLKYQSKSNYVDHSSGTLKKNFLKMSSEKKNLPIESSKEMAYKKQANDTLCPTTWEQEYPQSSAISSEMGGPSIDHQRNKSKRTRTVFTSFQLFQLESIFKSHRYLCRKQRIIVALKLSLCEKQVKIWFQNRRMKCKKEQQSLEAKPTKSKAQMVTEQTLHKGTVQRLMAYSCSPAIKPTEKLSCGTFTNQSCGSDLNEILDLLEETSPSSSQTSSSPSSNATNYCMDIQAIKQDLELAAQDWLTNTTGCENHGTSNVQPIYVVVNNSAQQPQHGVIWTPNVSDTTPMPSLNLTWGAPKSLHHQIQQS